MSMGAKNIVLQRIIVQCLGNTYELNPDIIEDLGIRFYSGQVGSQVFL